MRTPSAIVQVAMSDAPSFVAFRTDSRTSVARLPGACDATGSNASVNAASDPELLR